MREAGLPGPPRAFPERPRPSAGIVSHRSSSAPGVPTHSVMGAPRRSSSRLLSESGFTLVETMMASLVLVIGVLGTLALIDTANSKTVATRGREAATSLARQLIEDVNDIPFRELSQTGVAADLQSNQGLESAPGSPSYTINRRGFSYAITVTVCSI